MTVGIRSSEPRWSTRLVVRKQRRLFRGLVLNSLLIVRGSRGFGRWVRESKTAVEEALAKENNVGKRVVNSQDGHGGYNALEDRTNDVEDIAEEPDENENQGKAVGRVAAEVFDNLGREDHDPTSNGN